MLTASALVKSFGGYQALGGCSLEIARQSITGIIGPNGAGKSTLFNVLGGLLAPESGDVIFEGRSILSLRPDERARIGLVRTFQISRELGQLTVLENMLLASPHQCGETVWRCFLAPSRVRAQERAAIQKARALLEQVNLWQLANEHAKNLSGGQKKLLEISRALMLDPKIILLDEPTAGVSPVMTEALAQTILNLRNQGLTFAIIEHDMDVIAQLCAPIYVLAEGRTLTRGTFREVASNGEVMNAYLGEGSMSEVLRVSGLHAGYGAGDILKGIDVVLDEGRIVTLIGPNGSGKSTLIKTLAGLLPARQGTIDFLGQRLNEMSAPKRVRAGIAYVPQEYNVFRNLTVLENIKIAREFMSARRTGGEALDDELLALFPELPAHYRKQAGNLSGGQRQMLAFACALSARPKVLMLDEPSAGLSPKYMSDVFDRIRKVNAMGVSVLMVEQNALEALRIADTCIVLAGGRVRTVAPASEVLGMKDLNSLYLGDAQAAAG